MEIVAVGARAAGEHDAWMGGEGRTSERETKKKRGSVELRGNVAKAGQNVAFYINTTEKGGEGGSKNNGQCEAAD